MYRKMSIYYSSKWLIPYNKNQVIITFSDFFELYVSYIHFVECINTSYHEDCRSEITVLSIHTWMLSHLKIPHHWYYMKLKYKT